MFVRRAWPSYGLRGGFPDLDQLQRDLSWFADAMSGVTRGTTAGVFPAMNVTQDKDAYYLRAELPGINAKELDLSVVKNKVSLAGKREVRQEEGVSYHRRERSGGAFSRSVTLPLEVDAERVQASYTDGLLTVTLPKAEATKPRQVTVRTA